MSYNKTTWVTGDIITAEKLNNIENEVAKIDGISTDLDDLSSELTNEINSLSEDLSGDIDTLSEKVTQVERAVGAPMVASLVSQMTDQTRVYVYTGSETGYTAGNWYYYNGTAWVSGGVYNSVAVETDKTLSVEDEAADAKAVGDEIKNVAAVSNTQPSSEFNKIWVKETPQTEVQVPTISEFNAVVGDVSSLKSELNKQFIALSDAENNLQLNFFYEAEVTGTTKKAVPCNAIPSGTYTLSIDEVVSSDTDENQCLIGATYSDDTNQYYSVNRGTDISVSVTFIKEVKRLTFYASTNESKSSGDTFTYTKVKVYQFTEMKTRFEDIDADISVINYKIALNNDSIYINNLYANKLISKAEGYEGDVLTAVGSTCTDFVYVRNNTQVRVVGCYLTSNRSICGYDHNMQFVTVLAGGTSDTDVTITIPTNVTFIRITGKTDVTLSANYVGVVSKYDNQASFGELSTENGYMISSATGVEGARITQSSSSCTDFIRVIPNTVVKVSGCYVASFRSICCYDANKKFISVLVTGQSAEMSVFSLPIPNNARYIRITAHKDETPAVVYLSRVLNEAISPEYQKNASLFDNATKVPVLTFVDDDTYGTTYVTRQKNLCDSLGIKCSFACLTAQVESDSELLNTLLEFEKEGFPIIYHANTQGNFYNTPTLDIVAEEEDFVTGLHKMHEYGFADYKIWATPFGSSRDDEKKLAIKWGLLGLLTSGRSEINNPYLLNPESRWDIQRISLGTINDTQASDLTAKVAQLKSAIDDAVACNGWVCVSTHSAYPVYRTGEADSAMSEIVAYALSKGVEIRTINEQLRRWMPIYNYYEQY